MAQEEQNKTKKPNSIKDKAITAAGPIDAISATKAVINDAQLNEQEAQKQKTVVDNTIVTVSQLPESERLNYLNSLRDNAVAKFEQKAKEGQTLTKGEKVGLTLATALPTLIAGLFGGDERATLKAGSQIVSTWSNLKEQEKQDELEAQKTVLQQYNTMVDDARQAQEQNRTYGLSREQFEETQRANQFTRQTKGQELELERQKLGLQSRELEAKQKEVKPNEAVEFYDKEQIKEYSPKWAALPTQKINRKRLQDVVDKIDNYGKVSGTVIIDQLPDNFKVFFPKGQKKVEVKDMVKRVAIQSVKETFGGQLSNKETELKIESMWNDKLPTEANIQKVKDTIFELDTNINDLESRKKYFEENKTLFGYDPSKVSPTQTPTPTANKTNSGLDAVERFRSLKGANEK